MSIFNIELEHKTKPGRILSVTVYNSEDYEEAKSKILADKRFNNYRIKS